jgi:predicted permease
VSVAVVAMLAAATGAAVTSFGIEDSLVERPVPFPGGERIHRTRGAVTPDLLRAIRAHAAFEWAFGVAARLAEIETARGLERVPCARVADGLLHAIGARAQVGRLLSRSDYESGALDRIVLSDAVWRSVFGGDPEIVGTTVHVDGAPFVVVGVAAAGLHYPDWNTQAWLPLDDSLVVGPSLGELHVRLASGVTRQVGRDVFKRLQEDLGLRSADDTSFITFRPLIDALPEHQRLGFRALGAGAALIFIAVCASVASLLLAQLTVRRRDFGTHVALGASPGRIFRQALFEHGSLGVIGVGLGVWVANQALVQARTTLPPSAFSSLNPFDLDARAKMVAALLGVVVVSVAGALPALTSVSATRALTGRTAARGSSVGSRTTTLLLVAEIGLACSLLLGASVLVRSFVKMAFADRGFSTRGVGTATLTILPRAQLDRGDWATYNQAGREAILSLPAIREAVVSDLSLPGPKAQSAVPYVADIVGAPVLDLKVQWYAVQPDFFAFHKLPILAGRTFEPGDVRTDVIVSTGLAERLWAAQNPVGRIFRTRDRPYRVIGLAGEVRFPTVEPGRDVPEVYWPFSSLDYFSVTYRCDGACPPAETVKALEADLPPGLRINHVTTLDDVYGAALDQPRRAAMLGLSFSAVGLLTAAAGLFSVLSYAVSLRRREFGIRAAIGASPQQLRAQVLGEGARVAIVGLLVGVAGAWVLGRAITALQYGVTTADPLSWIVVLTGIGTMVVAASWRPAGRAMRADPSRLLLDE